ncbi:MAG: site-specific integrase [Ferruginibacter sp.]|nr:site-specific integrase [Ferruginibacter sp.]
MGFEKDFIHNNSLFRPRKLKAELPSKNEETFDYSLFYKKFPILLEDHNKPGTISISYLSFIKKFLREGRISSGINYHCSYVSLKKFKGNVRFTDITVSYLNEYESWLLNQDISITTVGMYLRPLRALFNEAIEDGIIKREKCYPFGRRKYKIPASKNIKKALDLTDVKRIYYYECDQEIASEQKARDFWLFSYFANGMNPKDIACLKYKNINDGYIVFDRSKTERAMRSAPKPITVFITEDMDAIIERWGNKDKSLNKYIFPVLEPGTTPLRQYELMQLFVSFINDWMKRILKKIGIDKKVTTYVARHTFSTVLKRSGASTEYIQEALGHTNVKTTENYLDSFGKEVKKEFSRRLTSFKNEEMEKEGFIN